MTLCWYWILKCEWISSCAFDDYADEYYVDDGDLRAPVHAVAYNGVAQLVLEAVREIGCHFNQYFEKEKRKEKGFDDDMTDQRSNWDHIVNWHLSGEWKANL